MNKNRILKSTFRILLTAVPGAMFFLAIIAIEIQAQMTPPLPRPLLVKLNRQATESTQILSGPPQTVTMHSGYVVLAPSTSVGIHSTKGNEEAVIVFSGSGEMRITGGPTLKLGAYTVAYCPPFTEHNVVNTGKDTLRYVYVVAKAPIEATGHD